jgi:methyl-accepting chemotaxis protein
MLTRATIGRRIGFGFLVLLLLFLGVGVAVIAQSTGVHEHTASAIERSELALTVNELLAEHDELHNRLWSYVQAPTNRRLDEETDPRRCPLGRWLHGDGRARLLALDATFEASLARLDEPHAAYHAAIERIAGTHDPAETLRLWTSDARPAKVTLRALLHDLQRPLNASARRHNGDVLALTGGLVSLQGVTLIVALLFGLGLAAWLTRGITGSLRQVAHRLAATSAELLAATRQQVQSHGEQVRAVAESTDAVDELRKIAARASAEVKFVADRALESEAMGDQGRQTLASTSREAEAARDRLADTAATLQGMAEHVRSVADVMAVVNDIADRTAVVALNASIEAVHAGESGGTFGVVAAEIRALAAQSKETTARVGQVLHGIELATREVGTATADTRARVDGAVLALASADATILKLTAVLAEAAADMTRATSAGDRQRERLARFHDAMHTIEAATTESQAAARQVTESARDLDDLGRELLAMIDRAPRARST